MVGIIANPASGKDIRRLVAQGAIVNNLEKVNVIQRIITSLYQFGATDILAMPENFGIVEKALYSIWRNTKQEWPAPLRDMTGEKGQDDSTRAAELLCKMGASCIVTLGGDGTSRAVAKGCGSVPLISLSTGTNNVFPRMIEGTVAGMAAAVADVAPHLAKRKQCKRLDIFVNGALREIALVDVAITGEDFVGARALWDPEAIGEIYLTTARPASIGISSIGSAIHPLDDNGDEGLFVEMGMPGAYLVHAPIMPGKFDAFPIRSHQVLQYGQRKKVLTPRGMIAVDGERELFFSEKDTVEIALSREGPVIIEVERTLEQAAQGGFFVKKA